MTDPSPDPIRVLMVDDQEIVRAGFRMILGAEPGIEVVGEAADGRAGLDQVEQLTPDVVLMDVQMPRMTGIEATRALVAAGSASRVLILTTFDDDEYLFEALRAGASGFLLKNCPADDLVNAIRLAAGGHALFAPEVTRRVIERSTTGPTPVADPRLDELTEREHDVLELMARGLSNTEIADRLVVSTTTVKSHVSRVLTKLDARDRVQAVILAHRSGMGKESS